MMRQNFSIFVSQQLLLVTTKAMTSNEADHGQAGVGRKRSYFDDGA